MCFWVAEAESTQNNIASINDLSATWLLNCHCSFPLMSAHVSVVPYLAIVKFACISIAPFVLYRNDLTIVTTSSDTTDNFLNNSDNSTKLGLMFNTKG